MALDTYQQIWNRLLLRCPAASPSLVQDWVTDVFRDITERRTWSWGWVFGEFLFNNVYTTGTVTVTFNNPNVVGTGTNWTTALQGRQFRTGSQSPIYTVLTVNSATSLTLSLDGATVAQWGSNSATNVVYQIYNAYQTVPANFKELISVVDPQMNWRLRTNVSRYEIDTIDPQRSNTGVSYAVVDASYTAGTSPTPLARLEFWPHQLSQYVLPYTYSSQPPDLQDPNAILPRIIRGDVVLEGALSRCAEWPGPSVDNPNPYFNLNLAVMHGARYERMLAELEMRDDAIYEQDLRYNTWQSLPFAVIPMLDSQWLQSHSI